MVNTVASLPLTLAFGSMGAGYGGAGSTLSYQQSATFIFDAIAGPLLIDLLGNTSLGNGFDSALFQIFDNGNLFESHSFNDLASAQAFFSNNNLIDVELGAGLNIIQLAFNETMSSGEGFGFNYAAAGAVSDVPEPSTWVMLVLASPALASWPIAGSQSQQQWHSVLYQLVNSHRIRQRGAARFRLH